MRVEALQRDDDKVAREVARRDPIVEEGWRWRFGAKRDSLGVPCVVLGRDEDNLLAAQGALPTPLVVNGDLMQGAQLVNASQATEMLEDEVVLLGLGVIEQLRDRGMSLAYSSPRDPDAESVLIRLGFSHAFDVVHRNLYLGVGPEGSRLASAALRPMQRLARYARRLRLKLIEVEVNDGWLGHAAHLFARHRDEIGFAVERSEAYLNWRYASKPEQDYRMLILRRRAGMGIDAFAIVRSYQYSRGRQCIQLIDHWTRAGERRGMAWLLGELALWGLSEGADVLQAFAASSSILDQTLVTSGCIRKKWTEPFMVRSVDTRDGLPDLLPERVHVRAGDLDHY